MGDIGKALKTAGKIAVTVGQSLIIVGKELQNGSKPAEVIRKVVKSLG